MDAFKIDYSKLLGKGSYGKVYKGIEKTTKRNVAVKICEIGKDGVDSTLMREIALLKILAQCSYFIRLLHSEIDSKEGKVKLVFEYMENSLRNYISKTQGPIPVKDFMFQICKGVVFCHSKGIIHRDLKTDNILFDEKNKIKICDLGFGRKIMIPTKSYSPMRVTPQYGAPEVLLGAEYYSLPVDIWSLGCIFAELVLREPLFKGTTTYALKKNIFSIIGTPSEEVWARISSPGGSPGEKRNTYLSEGKDLRDVVPQLDENGRNLLSAMLCCDPAQRITAKDVLIHPYFDGMA